MKKKLSITSLLIPQERRLLCNYVFLSEISYHFLELYPSSVVLFGRGKVSEMCRCFNKLNILRRQGDDDDGL